ncbi:MAG TPA: mandelate racemase/muconate lactonizing enzyme family protein [Chloroflexota bacterium]|nr:mandelate racemase/muconate lactonizing enzyme family protein [Chloroflexota bacterium]
MDAVTTAPKSEDFDAPFFSLATPDPIRRIRATPVNIPLEAPYRWSVGIFPGFSKTIVEVETTDGVVGVGEAPFAGAARLIESAIAPRLIGADPRHLADCERRALPPIRVLKNTDDDAIVRAYGGVEMALWDAVGKREGRSVASLLGGRVRDRMTVTEYFAPRLRHEGRGGEETPLEIAAYCARMAEQHGSRAFEGKVGVFDLPREVAMAREIRAAVGEECLLRLDANMAWGVGSAREALRRFAGANVASIEDPTRSLEEMARLRAGTSIAFSTHDPQVKTAARLGVPDAFCVNIAALGGIRRSVAFINVCEEMGIDVWFYSPDAGVANAAYLQVAAAMAWISRPSQTLLRWHRDEVIAEGPFLPRDGAIEVPEGTGLGVTLDRQALARCHQRFLDDGPYSQYDDPARPGRYSGWL